jgi:hypothetical protein
VAFIIENPMSRAMLVQFWVRQLIGEPVDFAAPDCEFDARRIHHRTTDYEADLSFWAAESNALSV